MNQTKYLFQAILISTALNYSGNSYGDYIYPKGYNALGWLLTMSSVVMVPVVMIWKMVTRKGSVRNLLSPSADWGPDQQNTVSK